MSAPIRAAICNPQRLERAISAGAEVLDYGSGWKEVWSPEPLLLAVQSLDQGVIVLPLGESFGIREDSEIELARCHGRAAVSQAHFVDRRADGTPVGGYPVNEVR